MLSVSLGELVRNLELDSIALENFQEQRVVGLSIDTRTIRKGEGFVALRGERFDGHNFLSEAITKGASFLVVDSMPKNFHSKIPLLLVQDTVLFLGQVAQWLREKSKATFIAVTGSVGKTTTKDMLYEVLHLSRRTVRNDISENNAIGVPKTIFKLSNADACCILELGTNHQGEIEYLRDIARPDVGILTCVGYSHLEAFKTLRGVYQEKISLFKDRRTIAILNADSPFLKETKIPNQKRYFGMHSSADVRGEFMGVKNNEIFFKVNQKYSLRLRTLGIFNIYNALAAVLAGEIMGVSLRHSCQNLSDFVFPKMRIEVIRRKGRLFVNDAYNANPTSFNAFLSSAVLFPAHRKIGVFADMLELGKNSPRYHKEILTKIVEAGFSYVIIIGKAFASIAHEISGEAKGIEMKLVSQVDEALPILRKITRQKDCIFLKGSRRFMLERIVEHL